MSKRGVHEGVGYNRGELKRRLTTGNRIRITEELRRQAASEYLDCTETQAEVAARWGVAQNTLSGWARAEYQRRTEELTTENVQ